MARHSPSDVTWLEVLGVCASYWRRWPGSLAAIVGLTVLVVAAELAAPLAIGGAIGALSAGTEIGGWLVALGAAMTVQLALRFALDVQLNRFSVNSVGALQLDAFGRVQRFSADWHANSFAGATVHKLSRVRWSFDTITMVLLSRLTIPLLMIVILGALLALRLPLAGVVFYGVAAAYVAVSVVLSVRWVRPANVAASRAESAMTGGIADAVTNNAAVKSFAAESREDARLAGIAGTWRGLALRSFNRASTLNALQSLMWTGMQLSVLAALAGVAGAAPVSAGDVAFAVAAILQLGGHLRSVGGDIRMLQRGFGEFAEAVEFVKAPFQVADAHEPVPAPRGPGEVTFDAVTFAYAGKPPLYEGFSLRIAAGERVGLVGHSGSGKSTFVKLLQRLYDVSGGRILIDGVDIAAVPQEELRGSMSIVPQDPALFHRSLAENIAYARPEASMEEIVRAAKRARAHEFILAAPHGYDTLVGERGVKLSGGERQRVALARAFLADCPLLILDEATSSVDTITERHIQAAIEELMAGRTTILIAHRLSTVRRADRILVFEEGRVVEQGRHEELLLRPGGRYRALHALHADDGLLDVAEARAS